MTTRRQFLAGAAALCAARPSFGAAPTAPVAVAKCSNYGADLLPTLQKMFDQLGGLERIVRNKTVAIKVNLDQDAAPYQPGFYTLDPRSLFVGEFQQLAIGRLKLQPIKA